MTATSFRETIERLERNHAENVKLLQEHGFTKPLKHVRCRCCGTREWASFWTVVELKGNRLELDCPACEGTRVRYDLSSNRIVSAGTPRSARFSSIAAMACLCYIFTALLVLSPEGRERTAEFWSKARASWTEFTAGDAQRPGVRAPGQFRSLAAIAGAPSERRSFTASDTEPGATAVLLVSGNQTAQIDRIVEEGAALHGTAVEAAVQRVDFVAEVNVTRLIVDTRSDIWNAYLSDRLAPLLEGSE